jgi:exopolysaccharide biosynthesis polyprenyl glycosylphosphotransferase
MQSLALTAEVTICALVFGVLVSTPDMLLAGPGRSHPVLGLLALGLTASLSWPLLFQQLGLYESPIRLGIERIVARLVAAGLLATLALVATAFVTAVPVDPSFPVLCGLIQLAVLAAFRLASFAILGWVPLRGQRRHNVLIVGSGPRAAYVQRVIERHPDRSLRIVGFIDDGPPEQGACVPEEQIYKLPDMPEILRGEVIDEVVVACPRSMLGSIVTVVDTCAAAGVPITLLSDIFGDYLPPPQVKRFGSLPALNFAPVHHSRIMLGVKRCIDVVGACVGLLLAAPIIAASVVAIKLTSPGPAFFAQQRCGLNGRRFKMVKLRTMQVGADEMKEGLDNLNEMEGGPAFKIRNDPRVTPVGRFLRRYSLDELPQFVDVLRGNMSLVGPRPSVPSEVDEYQTFERRRLSMRPGLTCFWQVSGRNDIGFDDWVRLDLQYIDTWSLTNDFKILLQTIPAVLRGTGAS